MRLLPATATAFAAALWVASALSAAQPPSAAVEFSPVVAAKLQSYGEAEAATLRSAIVAAVARETARQEIPAGLAVSVTLQDVEPTHPTRKQQGDNPSLDVVRTKFIGGAELAGEVRDGSGHVLAALTYRHFPITLGLGSSSVDPWADARLAIDQFAVKLAAAMRALPKGSGAG